MWKNSTKNGERCANRRQWRQKIIGTVGMKPVWKPLAVGFYLSLLPAKEKKEWTIEIFSSSHVVHVTSWMGCQKTYSHWTSMQDEVTNVKIPTQVYKWSLSLFSTNTTRPDSHPHFHENFVKQAKFGEKKRRYCQNSQTVVLIRCFILRKHTIILWKFHIKKDTIMNQLI